MHPGIKTMIFLTIKFNIKHPLLKKITSEVCKRCLVCQKYKTERKKKFGFYQIVKTPEEFLDDISVDYVGPINSQWGKGCILVAINRLSCFVWTIATSKTLGTKKRS
jgi:hypothetical protein